MCLQTEREPLEAAAKSQAYEEVPKPSPDDVLVGHPDSLDAFWKAHPEFLWGPCVLGALVKGGTMIPGVAAYLDAHGMEPYGFLNALHYTAFALILSYAVHAFVIVHAVPTLKIQSKLGYNKEPRAMIARSNAAICTELVFAVFPLAPASSSWLQDAWFFAAHKWAHENKWAYRTFHKTHHLNKHPNCFGAYFVTYQSHILLEQAVVLVACIAGLPRDAFSFYMYLGTLGTLFEHCGYELGSLKLPLVPLTLGHVTSALSFYAVGFLEGVNAAEHDWHHEKFTTNYALSFKYLDKLFGSYHPGRQPGTGLTAHASKKDE